MKYIAIKSRFRIKKTNKFLSKIFLTSIIEKFEIQSKEIFFK